MAQACGNCGKQLGDRSKFCPQCGAARGAGGRITTALVDGPVRMADGREAALDLGASVGAAPRRRRIADSASVAAGPVEPADFGQRLGAFLFDLLLFLIVLMVATFLLSSTSKKSIVSSNAMLAAF